MRAGARVNARGGMAGTRVASAARLRGSVGEGGAAEGGAVLGRPDVLGKQVRV